MASNPAELHTPPLVWGKVAARGNVRKWRLHACACARGFDRKPLTRKWLTYIELAEQYADRNATAAELQAAQTHFQVARKPQRFKTSGDFNLALTDSASLRHTWQNVVINPGREYTPDLPEYNLVLRRFRVLLDLIGPDQLPEFNREWRSDTVLSLAHGMYANHEYSAMPILADALQDAGCDDSTILDHCRSESFTHVRGCWVLDQVLGNWQGPRPYRSPRQTRAIARERPR